jgi:mRNA interferase RelE/StbE
VKYGLLILPRAQREIASIENPGREKVIEGIRKLQDNPRPAHSKKLAGREGWRLRMGNYRVIYGIDDPARIVTVLHVGHRREIYR